jgi:hypothetical protein
MPPFENYAFDSVWQNAFNLSQPKNKPKSIAVYVEGIEDKSFWFHILNPYINPLDFRCFSNDSLRTGKKGLNDHFDNGGEWVIICRDSDYDYLFPEHSETAKKIKEKSYIFQTYTYSIENLKCYAKSLHAVCTDVTHNPTEKINFVEFFEQYSKIIYELFIWHLYFYSESNVNEFTIEEFCKLIKFPTKFNLNSIDSTVFTPLKNRIDTKKTELEQKFPNNITKITLLSNQLKELGLEDKNAYLFIQGHTLHDYVVLPLLRVICDHLKTDSTKEINQSVADSERKAQVRNEYFNLINHSQGDEKTVDEKDEKIDRLKLVLSINKGFTDCFLFEKIKADIENYLATFKQHTQGLKHV